MISNASYCLLYRKGIGASHLDLHISGSSLAVACRNDSIVFPACINDANGDETIDVSSTSDRTKATNGRSVCLKSTKALIKEKWTWYF